MAAESRKPEHRDFERGKQEDKPKAPQVKIQNYKEEYGNSDGNSSESEEVDNEFRGNKINGFGQKEKTSNECFIDEDDEGGGRKMTGVKYDDQKESRKRMSLDILGLMKLFYGKKVITGAYEEDFENILNLFGTMARMCVVTEEEKFALCR